MPKKTKKGEQLDKIDFLINAGYKSLELHNKIYDVLNKKIMWFFTLIGGIQGYLLVNILFSREFEKNDECSFWLFIIIFAIGLTILGLHLYLLQLKSFRTGGNLEKQTKAFFSEDKAIYDLKFDTLGTLNDSYRNNDEVLNNIGKRFKFSIYLFFVYLLLIILYFAITFNMKNETLKESILPITSNNTGSQDYSDLPLTSDNTGKVDKGANPKK